MQELVISVIIIVAAIIFLVIFFSFVPVGLYISARASGVKIPLNKLEAHYLAGGNVDRVVNALIAAQRAGIPLDFERACAIDLAGRDVLNAVQMSVNPKVIETPVIAAIAKDGIELRAKARVTVRANLSLIHI